MTKFDKGSTVSCRLSADEWNRLQTYLDQKNINASLFIRELLHEHLGTRKRLTDFDEHRQTSVQSDVILTRLDRMENHLSEKQTELEKRISKLGASLDGYEKKISELKTNLEAFLEEVTIGTSLQGILL